MKRRLTIYGVLAAMVVGMVATVVPASASVKGRRNTALALTGAAAYELLRGRTSTGLVLGAGAAYAWKRTNDEKRAQARHRYYTYRSYRYRRYTASRRHMVRHHPYARRPARYAHRR